MERLRKPVHSGKVFLRMFLFRWGLTVTDGKITHNTTPKRVEKKTQPERTMRIFYYVMLPAGFTPMMLFVQVNYRGLRLSFLMAS
jgi:hypothetical protein